MKPWWILTFLFFTNCSLTSNYFSSENNKKDVWTRANDLAQYGRYEEAVDLLKKIEIQPSSMKLKERAKLKIGDIYFSQKLYPQAEIAYASFKEHFPHSGKISYATFQLATSLLRQSTFEVCWIFYCQKSTSRDLSLAKRSLLYFDEILVSHKNSPYYKKSVEYKKQITKALAEKELYVADFYYKNKKYNSAFNRYKTALGISKSIEPQALTGLSLSAFYSDQNKLSKKYYKLLALKHPLSKEMRQLRKEIGDELAKK